MKALYDHTIELIELTKLIERDVCDTMTVTNSLYRDYAVGVNPATVTTSSGLGSYKGNSMTPYLPGAEIAKGMWRKERAGQTAVRCGAEKHVGGDGVEGAFDDDAYHAHPIIRSKLRHAAAGHGAGTGKMPDRIVGRSEAADGAKIN